MRVVSLVWAKQWRQRREILPSVSVSVSESQSFLRERGVTFSDYRKHELSDLVQKAFEIKLPIDPEALIEDRAEVIGLKLRDLAGPENPRRRNVQSSAESWFLVRKYQHKHST